MSIKEVLNTSCKLAYDEHVDRLLSIPEKYLTEIKPNKQISYPDLFKSYNSDIAQELNKFGDKILAETRRVLTSKGVLSSDDKEDIAKSIENYLQAELYIKRFDIFVESIGRTLSRYGLIFEPEKYRVDMPKSLADVHAKNTCRKIQAKILNEVDVFMLSSKAAEPKVGVYSFINNLYNNHQFVFWGAGLVISVILGALLV
ncbi:hypothetical protein [Marinomonas polaris]|uniref:hypothetical protein n=1 Tax=Marinomonas polaris TaxID=293552 RepID=UPI003F99F762